MSTTRTAKPKNGKPPTKGTNPGKFLRMPADEWAACEAAARRDDRSLNDWIRRHLRKAVESEK